jgi:lysophospholipase L1-like esterase
MDDRFIVHTMNSYTIIFALAVAAILLIAIESLRFLRLLYIAHLVGKKYSTFSVLKPESRLRIAILGDSVAFGVGAKDPLNSLAGRIARDFPDAHVENWSKYRLSLRGIGDVLREHVDRNEKKFSVIFIMGGGMDVATLKSTRRIRADLRNIYDAAQKLSQEVVFVIPHNLGHVPMFRFPMDRLYSFWGTHVRNIYFELRTLDHVHLIDLYSHGDLKRDHSLFEMDLDHPTDEGYGIWYERIKKDVHEAIGSIEKNNLPQEKVVTLL